MEKKPAAKGAEKTIEGYIATKLSGWQSDVVTTLHKLVMEAAPTAKGTIKWAQPVYEENGPICYIKDFKGHVNFGFWRGAEMADPHGILQGDGDRMRHINLTGVQDIKPDLFKELVRTAVQLNRTLGDPTKEAMRRK